MRKVYKYPLDLEASVTVIELPEQSRVLHTATQDGQVTLWIEVNVDPIRNKIRRLFVIVGTGHEIPPLAQYVGTAYMGPFVWHVYEQH